MQNIKTIKTWGKQESRKSPAQSLEQQPLPQCNIFDQKQYIFDHQQLISIIHFAEMIKLKVDLQQIRPTKLHGKRKPLRVGCDWSENSMCQVTVQAVWNR